MQKIPCAGCCGLPENQRRSCARCKGAGFIEVEGRVQNKESKRFLGLSRSVHIALIFSGLLGLSLLLMGEEVRSADVIIFYLLILIGLGQD